MSRAAHRIRLHEGWRSRVPDGLLLWAVIRRPVARILVVEDDQDIAVSLQSVLQAHGYAVDLAFDGGTAVARALSEQYQLVVLDIMLPSTNGFKVCLQLREEGMWAPILMLTAKSGDWDQAESLDAGADDYLTKPVSMTVLLAHVRALIRRAQLFNARDLTADGLTLDPVRHCCSDGTSEIELSAREIEVLACLMVHRDVVVSKADLIARVWGERISGQRKHRGSVRPASSEEAGDPVRPQGHRHGQGKRLSLPHRGLTVVIAHPQVWRSMRFRITVPSMLIVSVVVAGLAVILVESVQNHLVSQVDRGLVNEAHYVRAQLAGHHILPSTTPSGEYGQFFLADGTLVGATNNLRGARPLVHVVAAGPSPRLTTISTRRFGRLRVLEEQLGTGSAPILVEGQRINQITNATRSLTVDVAVGAPLLVLAVGLLIWLVVGRAMKTVESVRVAVAEISEEDLDERVSNPRTGDELERLVLTMNVMLERLQGAIEQRTPVRR